MKSNSPLSLASLLAKLPSLTIDKTSLSEYLIEYIPIDIQNSYVISHMEKYKKAMDELKQIKYKMNNDILSIL